MTPNKPKEGGVWPPSAMSTFGSAAVNKNHDDDVDNIGGSSSREVFEAYAYTTFGTVAARRIVEDVQDVREDSLPDIDSLVFLAFVLFFSQHRSFSGYFSAEFVPIQLLNQLRDL